MRLLQRIPVRFAVTWRDGTRGSYATDMPAVPAPGSLVEAPGIDDVETWTVDQVVYSESEVRIVVDRRSSDEMSLTTRTDMQAHGWEFY